MPPDALKCPRISVVIPCFNDGQYLVQAIASVREDEEVSVIVVDDASSDPETLAVLRRLRDLGTLTIVQHPANVGAAQAINTGVRRTKTPYAFILGADDLAENGALAKMADVLMVIPKQEPFGVATPTLAHEPARSRCHRWTHGSLSVNRWPGVAMVRVRHFLDVGGLDALGPL